MLIMKNSKNVWTRGDILGAVKQDLLLGRLELEDTGLTLADIKDDEKLLDDNGLALDSVDALDLIVGIEKLFSFKVEEISKEFIERVCLDLSSLVDFIVKELEGSKAV
jgi:acyl carrier protein